MGSLLRNTKRYILEFFQLNEFETFFFFCCLLDMATFLQMHIKVNALTSPMFYCLHSSVCQLHCIDVHIYEWVLVRPAKWLMFLHISILSLFYGFLLLQFCFSPFQCFQFIIVYVSFFWPWKVYLFSSSSRTKMPKLKREFHTYMETAVKYLQFTHIQCGLKLNKSYFWPRLL